eukprot:gnl/TRDRNA2_/TRDRNA2_64200_c1_seq1.p1 gnl/TRDRNA2_/TRDRNA2_64200_c1~~gnl/TRDRNA2_/TRDRNA2_64200_c1_seq1.p1  ORF type:complete len:191 (+),score=13.83 gnl/TRDRNA2_/TRDRNA2_64200_c1_seq1:2-574(+)
MATPHIFVRAYIHEYLPAVPRAIWLDHDTVIKSDISLLYQVPMKNALAAVLESEGNVVEFQAHQNTAPALYQNLTPTTYFNSGVLVYDLERWRSGNITRAILSWLELGAWDQLALNLPFQGGNFDRLSWRWNVQCLGKWPLHPCCDDEVDILHWTCGEEKPWFSSRSLASKANDRLFEHHLPRQHCRAWM